MDDQNEEGEESSSLDLTERVLWGATIGGVVAVPAGWILLMALLSLSHTSGDQATGAAGLIILAIPVGAVIGGVIGGCRGRRSPKKRP